MSGLNTQEKIIFIYFGLINKIFKVFMFSLV